MTTIKLAERRRMTELTCNVVVLHHDDGSHQVDVIDLDAPIDDYVRGEGLAPAAAVALADVLELFPTDPGPEAA